MNRQTPSLIQVPISAFIWFFLLLSAGACRPFEPEQLVIIKTGNVSEVGVTSFKAHGEILDTGENGISQHGFIWSDQPDPDFPYTNYDELGPAQGPGTFSDDFDGLSPGTIYYVKAYAVTTDLTVYGPQVSFETQMGFPPTVSTKPAIEITPYSAISGGQISDDGGVPVMTRGVCWATHREPTIENSFTSNGEGPGEFVSTLESLEPYTTYHLRAYATNEIGTGYGEEILFMTLWNGTPVFDFEGNEYPTVQIGNLIWTVRNIRSTKYSDGIPISLVEDDLDWAAMSDNFKAYCYYNNDPVNAEKDGALYTWSAATNGHPDSHEVPSGVQGVCPAGWHLPSDEEWKAFEMMLGMNEDEVNAVDNWRGSGQGGKLKETINWTEPNVGAENEFGFNARPSGYRESIGRYGGYGTSTDYWTSTESGEGLAVFRRLSSTSDGIFRSGEPVKKGFSVRCVKDY